MAHEIISISKNDERYPKEFLALPAYDQPSVIYAMGNLDLLSREKKAAVIGARKADEEGLAAAFALGKKFADDGYVVVSGLALGCDAAAHRGCLAAGGETIAIVATGLDIVQPLENAPLQEEILAHGGLVISEQPLGRKGSARRLVARNRLQAAISEVVVVAQCSIKSGTLHTVRFAKQYGKRIEAVSYTNPTPENEGNRHIIANETAGLAELATLAKSTSQQVNESTS